MKYSAKKYVRATSIAMIGIGSLGISSFVGAAAPERESALKGSSYAIVAPTFNSTTGSQSYIRLFNGGLGSATFTLTVLGSSTGNTYGTASITIPQYASPQYSLNTLATLASAGSPTGADTGFTLYFQNAEPWAGYQHVSYNNATTLFGNNSACYASTTNEVHGVHNMAVLTNVHTTLLSGYPSTIYIHNPNSSTVSYHVVVVDAGYADSTTGALDATAGNEQGSFDVSIAANSTYSQSFSSVLSQIGWSPSGSQYHANVLVYDPTGANSAPVLGQQIVTQSLGGQVDMSAGCSVTPTTQVQSALTSASVTRYCVTAAATGSTSGKIFFQTTTAGALTLYQVDPGSGNSYTWGTGTVTGTNFSATIGNGGKGSASGTITNGTVSGTYTTSKSSGTLSGATCN